MYNMASKLSMQIVNCVKCVIVFLRKKIRWCVDVTWQSFLSCVFLFFLEHAKEMIIAWSSSNHIVTTNCQWSILWKCNMSCSWSCPYLHVMMRKQNITILQCVLYLGIYFVLPKNIDLWKLFCKTQKIFVHFFAGVHMQYRIIYRLCRLFCVTNFM